MHNEASKLKQSVILLQSFISDPVLADKVQVKVVIVDNASTDDTARIGFELTDKYDNVEYLRLKSKGLGYGLKTAWLQSDADVVAYININLFASLTYLNDLVLPLLNDEADIVFGSRLQTRMLSRSYNRLLNFFMAVDFKDSQFGFKAIQRDVFKKIEPDIKSKDWFFNTELLLQSEYGKYRTLELPIAKFENYTSKPKWNEVKSGIKTMAQIYYKERPYSAFHRLFSFGMVGLITTIGYGLMYYLLARVFQTQLSIFLTLSAMTLINVALNRRFTYRKTTSESISIHYIMGVTAFLLSWGISGGGLSLIEKVHGPFSDIHETFIVVSLSLVGTIVKYMLFHIGFNHTPKNKK